MNMRLAVSALLFTFFVGEKGEGAPPCSLDLRLLFHVPCDCTTLTCVCDLQTVSAVLG